LEAGVFLQDGEVVAAELADDYAMLLAEDPRTNLEAFAFERRRKPSTDPPEASRVGFD
jgi:hypothetical protein